MGNACSGPSLGGKGLLGTVSDALWRSRPSEDCLPPPSDAGTGSKNAANPSSKDAHGSDWSPPNNSAPAQNRPPETMKMPGSQDPKPVARDLSIQQGRADKQAEEVKTNKTAHMKRVSSAGLQVESVLGRKTGNLKEIYNLGRKLGQGQFGTTFLCTEKATGKEFACKTIAKRKLLTQEDVEDVRREIQILHHMAGHPNVISIIDAYEDAVAVHLVMELCAGGELFDRIVQRGHYTERKAAELARLIVGVVEACHSLGVMHRDLKPENFLFVNQEEESPIKSIDFGLSTFFRPGIRILI
ncbi:hypothetical protein SAY87_009022 [Trapa incisa]|uniref:non-specific serine/threonine protein kinase n=1 Tax=Trapa incisa TaxID=236973 RepID=A0AAN7JUG8_9MYRT|nr:hypothetical protein SAY87_009022 [Trapa incisa]